VVCFQILHESGERIGSAQFERLPRPGDFISPRHLIDFRPAYQVVRCDFVGHDIRVIVTDKLIPRRDAETVGHF
jgi:hypothetical protein